MSEKRVNTIFLAIILFSLIPNKLFISPRYATDSSWQIAVNNAFMRHYVFGKDMIFTYGPLGFLSYGLPLGLGVWSIGIVLYKLLIITGLFVIGRNALLSQPAFFGKLMIGFAFIFCGKFYAFDPAIFGLLFITLGCIYALGQPDSKWLFCLGFLAVLSFFIKMNSGFVGGLFVLVTLLFLLIRKKLAVKPFLLVTGINLGIGLLLTILLHVDMAGYITHGLAIVNYYNDAMVVPLLPRAVTPISVFALTVLFLVFFVAAFRRATDKLQWGVSFLLAAAFCFILFKQGFVVATGNHELIFFSAIPFLFLGLSDIKSIGVVGEPASTINWLVIFFTICAIFNIGYMTFHSRWLRDLYMKEPVTIREMPAAIKQRIGNNTVDIFPADIDRLYFEKLNFTTRPIPQGYSVYHSSLDSVNALFYRSVKAPRFVVSGIGSTPGRHPFWDETNTKIAVRENYHIVDSFRFTNEVERAELSHFYLLERNASPAQSQIKPLFRGIHKLNEKITIPGSQFPVLLKVTAHYSTWNKLKRFFFQPTLLRCRIDYEDGTFSEHNAILPTIAAGVIINKRLLSNEDGAWFFGSPRTNVSATAISFKGDKAWFDENIEISFSEIR
ncbi:hypothetical protein BH10BAC3_BH10BAC3_33830 [soil metagenome]